MKTQWLYRNKKEWLIVFYNGWGMDSTPFRPLSSSQYDVLNCFDYTDNLCSIDMEEFTKLYDRIVFIGWSMGVLHGQRHFQDAADYFDKIIAINGTLLPVDDVYGIPVDICKATLDTLKEETLQKFYRRMCRSSSVLRKFTANSPRRAIDDIRNELDAIMSGQQGMDGETSIYTDIIISDNDMIIPTKNQIHFWKKVKTGNIKRLESSHFPFYLWDSWDELLAFSS